MTGLKLFETPHPFDTDVDISTDEFLAQPYRVRDETFAWLRENFPVSWHPPMDGMGIVHNEQGFWAVTKAADIRYVSTHPDLFSSALSGRLHVRPVDFSVKSMLTSDPPEHTKLRRIMSAGFTPKAVNRLVGQIEERAAKIVDRVVGAGDIDFVKEVSSRLPMETIADLFGVPESMVDDFTTAGDNFASGTDPSVLPEGVGPAEFLGQQIHILAGIGLEIVAYRRSHPADDLATIMAQAQIDGRPMNDEEIIGTTMLFTIAGNDTTKQTTSWAVHQLWSNPDQKRWLAEDYDNRIGNAIEEFIRHASPVQTFPRTATQDTVLAGREVSKYDKVVMYYSSANRDEDEFVDPWKFDLARKDVDNQVSFGGGGVHYCMGSAVAKAQLRALFRQFLLKLPDMEVGEPEMLLNETFNYTRKLPVSIP